MYHKLATAIMAVMLFASAQCVALCNVQDCKAASQQAPANAPPCHQHQSSPVHPSPVHHAAAACAHDFQLSGPDSSYASSAAHALVAGYAAVFAMDAVPPVLPVLQPAEHSALPVPFSPPPNLSAPLQTVLRI